MRLVCSLAGIDPDFLRSCYVEGRIRLDLLLASETRNKRDAALELVRGGSFSGDQRSVHERA
jgi:hypothetical protein